MINWLKKRIFPCVLCVLLFLSGCSGQNQSASPDTLGDDMPSGVPSPLTGMGNTPSNLMNNGTAAAYGDSIYYVDRMMWGSIWKMPTGGGTGTLLQKGTFHDLNVNGGLIYTIGNVLNPETDLYADGIFQMDTDGANLTLIKEGYFEQLILCDDYLFFTDQEEGGLYRMRRDGEEEKLLLSGIYSDFTLLGGSLYVCAELAEEYVTNVYCLPLDGSADPTEVIHDIFGGGISTDGKNIYYIGRDNTSNTYRYNTKTGGTDIFFSNWIDLVNTDGESMYYFWNGVRMDKEDSGYYRCNPDGGDAVLMYPSEGFYQPNIAGGKIFWHCNDEQRRMNIMNLDGTGLVFVEQAAE